MSVMGLAAISIFLLLVAWRQWLEREADKHTVLQGILMVVLLAAWFFRIVFAE